MGYDIPPVDLLAIARMPFLTALEKIVLVDTLDGMGGLRALCTADIETIIGRRLRGAVWNHAEWQSMATRDAAFMRNGNAWACPYHDPLYPPLLRETARPPFMLYIRGRLPAPDQPCIAMVGTRYPTGGGLRAAADLACAAANSGIAVVSGLARGIDAAVHRGAMAGAGPTFAVLGCGIDLVYPRSNKELASRMIAAGGGLISEYPPGVGPTRWTFPERNRILAGLCRSTVVVEAPVGSGALITAAFALEEGRDVYVAEACLGSPRSAGAAGLATDGASRISSIQDIFEDWHSPAVLASAGPAPASNIMRRRA